MESNEPEIPEIFNSKTERVLLELPNYAYAHSSSAEDKINSFFLGRKQLVARLKNLIISTSSKTGVYLVAGNRGVGKSSLVNKVIEETSPSKVLLKYSNFFIVTFFLVLSLQYVTNQHVFCNILTNGCFIGFLAIIDIFFFFLIGYRSYNRKEKKEGKETKCLIRFWNSSLMRIIMAAIIEVFSLPHSSNPSSRTQNVRKFIFILISCHIIAIKSSFTHVQVFFIYLSAILGESFALFLFNMYKESYKNNIYKYNRSIKKLGTHFQFLKDYGSFLFTSVFFIFSTILIYTYNENEGKDWLLCMLLCMLLCIIVTIILLAVIYGVAIVFERTEFRETKEKGRFIKYILKPLVDEILKLILNNYTKNFSRVYLKINFGHDILKERDILRLITRTLSSEYNNFCRSWKHTFHWRILYLAIVLLASYLFYEKIYKNDLLPLIEQNDLYKKSSQRYYTSDSNVEIDSLKNYLTDTIKDTINFKKYIIQTDKAINRIWCYVLSAPKYFWQKKSTEIFQMNYNFFLPINYAMFLIFLIFYLSGKLVFRKLFTTHYTIRKRLKQLNESITYNVEREVGTSADYKGLKATIKNKKSRIIADEREIEKELQDILNNIQKIPMFMARPEFVIIFEELDKVSPELKEEILQDGKTKETMFAQDSTRERQALILKLLSNMKYFLYTANAKFIFIAGREMYDMYLADIADRNNYFGSIFNDVIFVPSFLSDNDRQYNITALTEEFVCRHLIPENYQTFEWNLKNYRQYLEDVIYSNKENSPNKNETDRKIQKIIAVLQQFIIYLAYTSKGAPKKMIQIFESFIVNANHYEFKDKKLIARQFRNTNFLLSFDYYNQFTIGMTSYLISPIINRLTDANIKEHSDKLIVSTLYFIDYMLKFHNQNFSWRQLDISPEVVETNNSPELKSIINDIVTLYEQIYIAKPFVSLFEIKFDKLLSQEISFISKMDERFSAQFNFSLDESLALKQYYGNLLKKKQIEYKEFKDYGTTFINSISSLQIILGDLHFLDDELEEAALYYKDGIRLIHKKWNDDKEQENLNSFYLLICNQLKLAYLYEKREQPEFAYLLYNEIVKSIVEVRDSCVNTEQIKSFEPTALQIKYLNKNITFESLQLFYLPLLAKLQILEKRNFVGILKRDIDLTEKEFIYLISKNNQNAAVLTADFYSKIGDILYYKNKVFSEKSVERNYNSKGIKILHYACYYYKKALIALVLDENHKEKEFHNMSIIQILRKQVMFICEKTSAKYSSVMAQVLSNLGDVYFSAKDGMCEDCDFAFQNCKICHICNSNGNKNFWKNFHKLFDSKDEFNVYLDKFFKDLKMKKKSNSLDNIELALFLYSLSIKFYKKANLYKQAAFQITKILNCFKYCLRNNLYKKKITDFYKKDKIKYIASRAIEFLYMANEGMNEFELLKRKEDFNKKINLQYIQVDSEINRITLLEKQLTLLLCNDNEKPDILNKLYTNYLISPYCINYSIYTHFNQLNLKAKLNWNAYEIMENQLGLKTLKNNDIYDIYVNILKILITDCSWNGSETHRIFGDIKFKKTIDDKYKFFVLFEMLISDSIFCYTEMLHLIKTSNDSYIFNHRMIAESYKRLAIWTNRYKSCKRIKGYIDEIFLEDNVEKWKKDDIKDAMEYLNFFNIKKDSLYPKKKQYLNYMRENYNLDSYLENFLEKDFKEQLSRTYYRQKAFLHYHKSLETHSGGRAYFNLLEQMYFVKGDYDDSTSHFNVAVERFMINQTNGYSKDLDKLKKINEDSPLYKADNYFEKSNSK